MTTKTAPTLETLEGLLNEVCEWYGHVSKITGKMGRVKRGSEAYLDQLSDLWVELGVLSRKAQYAAEMIDAYQESLPEKEKA